MDKKAIFIVGNSRSGTTLMANILGKNDDVYSFNELHFFERFWTEKSSHFNEKKAKRVLNRLFCYSRKHPFEKCKSGEFRKEAETLLKGRDFPLNGLEIFKDFLFFETKFNEKKIPCEQTPRNLFFLEVILRFFPNARIIYMVRDPRDTTLSQKFKWKRIFKAKNEPYPLIEALRNFINYHPFTMAMLWKASAKAIQPFLNDKRVLCVHFESLIKEPEKVVKNVCDFVEIDYSPEMLEVPYAFSSVFKDEQKRKGLDSKRTGNWKKFLTKTEVFIIQKVNSEYMEQFGYKVDDIKPEIFGIIYYFIVFFPKMFFAVLFNLSRNKSVFSSISSRLRSIFK